MVEVRKGSAAVRTPAVANSGYEAGEAEVHLPLALARRLGFCLKGLAGARYRVVGGFTSAYVVGEVLVRVVTSDRRTPWVRARAVSVPGEHEVLLSDRLLDALGIEIVRAGDGLWRFHGEPSGVLRESAEARLWV